MTSNTITSRERAIADSVMLARVRFLLVQSPVGIVISPVACFIASLALAGEVQPFKLFVWNLGMVLLALLRFSIWKDSPRNEEVIPQPKLWEWRLAGSMIALSIWWGVGCLLVLPHTPLGDLLVFCIVMMMAGGTGSLYSIHPVPTATSVIFLIMPIGLNFMFSSDETFLRILGLTTPLFAGGVIRGLRTLNHYLQRSHELTFDLEENVRLLERSEEMRRDLTLMLVHDLRTPLTALMTHARMARDCTEQNNPEDSMEEIQYTVDLAHSLTTMINSILDVNRLESDEFPLSTSTVSISELLESSLQSMGTLEEEVAFEGPVDQLISCDVELVSRVIVNLLGNAVRYQPEEEPIRVVVDYQRETVEFRFIDRGPGVPVEDQQRIFDKYAQSGTKSQAYSYGLGLTFCKLAVERHGGTIGVESELGNGSEFWFRLPSPNHG